jgi:hypothetical protein
VNVRAFFRRNLSPDRGKHGPGLVVSVRPIVVLREPAIVPIDVSVTPRAIGLILNANVLVNELGTVQLVEGAQGARQRLGSPLNLWAIQWKHFILIKNLSHI